MKAWFLFFAVLIALSTVVVLFFLPNPVRMSVSTGIEANPEAVRRLLLQDHSWTLWWPERPDTSSHLVYRGVVYQITQKQFQAISLRLTSDGREVSSEMILIPNNDDSLTVRWQSAFEPTTNPIARIKLFYLGQRIHSQMNEVLNSLKSFSEKQKNLYGINVDRSKVKDTVLAIADTVVKNFPSPAQVNALQKRIRSSLKSLGRTETGHPMLNIDSSSGRYEVTVAIPVDLSFSSDQPRVTLKRMVPGNLLCVDVKGGRSSLAFAYRQLELYMQDHQMRSPAIPYEVMLTDRAIEPDTSLWMSRICYPVF